MHRPLSVTLVVLLLTTHALHAQSTAPSSASGIEGVVVSVSANVLTVKTDDNRYLVFVLDRRTPRPPLDVGMRIRVRTDAAESTDEARTATAITVLSPTTAAQDPVPDEVRRIERDIERTARRYRAGIRAGVALDPELISIGAHATLGPFFAPRLFMRPNVEVAYGELTTLFAVNLEGIYRLRRLRAGGSWSPYAGGGATLGFSHQGFSGEDGGRSFDFNDLDFKGGISILAGLEKPSGVFIELKSTVYTDPHLRLLFGITF